MRDKHFKPVKNLPAKNSREPDLHQVYKHLFQQSRKDYRAARTRETFKKTLLMIIMLFSAAGLFLIIFYFSFLDPRLKHLHQDLIAERRKVSTLSSRVEEMKAVHQEYKSQIEAFQKTLGELKIEDNLVKDVDLSDIVRRNLNSIGRPSVEFRNLTRGNTGIRETALTFDLGTGEELPYVYSVLKKFKVKATIFISNEMPSLSYGALFNPGNINYLIKMGQLGCEFGNHTWSHYDLNRSLLETSKNTRLSLLYVADDVMDSADIQLELDRVEKKFYEQTGYNLAPLWRVPYGAINHTILSIAAEAGYPAHVFWSANKMGPLDFYDYITDRFITVKDPGTGTYYKKTNPYYFTSGEMLNRLKQWEKTDPHGLNGAIAICHLGTSRKTDKIIKILPHYISYFQNKGYRFVTVSRLMENL
ncbi:MAG: polysaccharide deacetylase family protein [Spirochaetota bacterium]